MIEKIKNMFKRKNAGDSKKYEGLSDFFMNAPADEQKKVLLEAARRSNEDQMKVFREAQLKTESN